LSNSSTVGLAVGGNVPGLSTRAAALDNAQLGDREKYTYYRILISVSVSLLTKENNECHAAADVGRLLFVCTQFIAITHNNSRRLR